MIEIKRVENGFIAEEYDEDDDSYDTHVFEFDDTEESEMKAFVRLSQYLMTELWVPDSKHNTNRISINIESND